MSLSRHLSDCVKWHAIYIMEAGQTLTPVCEDPKASCQESGKGLKTLFCLVTGRGLVQDLRRNLGAQSTVCFARVGCFEFAKLFPKMVFPAHRCLQLAFFAVLYLTVRCDETPKECGAVKNAKAETYLETAAALIDKLRENLPEEGKTDCSCPPKPMDCDEVMQCGHNRSGVFQIWPRNRVMFGSVYVYCDMETSGGGWTVIQRRGDYRRPADFFLKTWHSYKNGFGDLRRDFWLGNDNIYALTNQKKYYLRIDLTDYSNNSRYAFYDQFWLDGEHHHYKLHAYDYSGDAGDALSRTHDGQKFSTIDRDNDNSTYHCAQKHKGGWWFGDCHTSNLNGMYNSEKVKSADGIIWSTWRGPSESLKMTEMKIRPMDFKAGLLDMDIDAV
ncbi:Techylectin-5A [Araneus ventricosus]|uniref:Techylectin-5A n=1 Tax=Araneus ventricosus TaxID=182803 RepID=A0A4Y2IED9_ARAVE|nr:Techylectin-5A [Araneus ventricosus]